MDRINSNIQLNVYSSHAAQLSDFVDSLTNNQVTVEKIKGLSASFLVELFFHLVDKTEEAKNPKALWKYVESALEFQQKERFVNRFNIEVNNSSYGMYMTWLSDPELVHLFILEFPHMFSNNAIEVFETYFACCLPVFPRDSLFLRNLFQCEDDDVKDWINNQILPLFTSSSPFPPQFAAWLFFFMTDEQREFLKEGDVISSHFVSAAAEDYFAIEERPSERLQFLNLTLWQLEFEKRMEFWQSEIIKDSPLLPYLHLCISPQGYRGAATNIRCREIFNQLVLKSWKGTQEEKWYIVEELSRNFNKSSTLKREYQFNYDINNSQDFDCFINILNFCSNHVEADNEFLNSVMSVIQRIPPLLIALAMNTNSPVPDYPGVECKNVLVRMMVHFTEEQREACALFFPRDNIDGLLDSYKDRIPYAEFVSVLHAIPHDISGYVIRKMREEDPLKLENECLEWLQKVPVENNINSSDALTATIIEGKSFSLRCTAISNHFSVKYVAKYSENEHVPPFVNEINGFESKAKFYQAQIKAVLENLSIKHKPATSESEELADCYLCGFTPPLMQCLNLEGMDQLGEWELDTNAGFEKIGLSLENLKSMEILKKMVHALRGTEQNLDYWWNNLSHGTTFSEEDRGQEWEKGVVEILSNGGKLDKVPEVAAFIRHHFETLLPVNFTGTLQECVHFLRVRQFDFVVYHHVKNLLSDGPRNKKRRLN